MSRCEVGKLACRIEAALERALRAAVELEGLSQLGRSRDLQMKLTMPASTSQATQVCVEREPPVPQSHSDTQQESGVRK